MLILEKALPGLQVSLALQFVSSDSTAYCVLRALADSLQGSKNIEGKEVQLPEVQYTVHI